MSQVLFSGGTPVNGLMIANNTLAILYGSDVNTATAGGASLPIAVSGVLITPSGYKPAGAVSVFGGTTGQAFAARRW